AEREELGYHGHAGEVASELAYHYSRANNRDKAIEYFRLAGDRAAARGAFTEAERAYRQSLTMLNLDCSFRLGRASECLGTCRPAARSWPPRRELDDPRIRAQRTIAGVLQP